MELQPWGGARCRGACVQPGLHFVPLDVDLHTARAQQVEEERGEEAVPWAPQPRVRKACQAWQQQPSHHQRGEEPSGGVVVVGAGGPELAPRWVERLSERQISRQGTEAVGAHVRAPIADGAEDRQEVDRVDSGEPSAHESGERQVPFPRAHRLPTQYKAAEEEKEGHPSAAPHQGAVQPAGRISLVLVIMEGDHCRHAQCPQHAKGKSQGVDVRRSHSCRRSDGWILGVVVIAIIVRVLAAAPRGQCIATRCYLAPLLCGRHPRCQAGGGNGAGWP
mmetsp:Transcript_104231/g.222819  ORF Transcript_104231/g.222819 Transcript_104231/m.222819 type:complete len:277 (+) Transcript_104231:376-1206(+)